MYSCSQLHNARWLTLANRICRLYISTEDPEENLQTMTNFIIFYFAPSWFDIKHHSSICNGPKNFFRNAQRLNELSSSVQTIVKPVLERNAYFAHVENVLLAMLVDDNQK